MDFKKKKRNLTFIKLQLLTTWKLVSMGKNNIIGPYVVIGTETQHTMEKSDGNFFLEM